MNNLKQILQYLLQFFKDLIVENNQEPTRLYTEDELMARLKFFIGICLSLTLFGIVFVVLYSLIFVTQPLNAISPIDQKFFELIVPIATFLTGTLSGIMLAGGDKEAQHKALEAANKGWDKPPTPSAPAPQPFNPMPYSPAPVQMYGAPMAGTMAMPAASSDPLFGDFQPQVTMSASGKPMPMQPPQPLI
jgi:hypothetical protein